MRSPLTGGGSIDRRRLLGTAGGLTAAAVLAPQLFGRAEAAVGGELNVLAWEGFTLENELADWCRDNGVTLKISIISTQDDVQGKLIGSTPIPLDVSEYNHGFGHFYADELKITKPFDPAKLPNYAKNKVFDRFLDVDPWLLQSGQQGVPWIWGLNGLLYNPKVIEKVETYKDLLRPELSGKLTFGDDTLATWPMIARVAGFGDRFPNLTEAELAAAFEAVKPYRDQCRVFSASNGDTINLFASGEIGAIFAAWTGIPTETAKQGVETRYALPEEGASMWVDAWFIPRSTVNPDTAHAYVNQSLDPKVQAAVCKAVAGGTVTKEAVQYMDADTKALFDYSNLDEVFRKAPLQGQPPRASDVHATYDQWIQAWTDFKSGF